MDKISLNGTWRFRLDPNDLGSREHWENQSFKETVQIPGILQASGYGDEISAHTDWISSLHDPLWHLRDEYSESCNADGTVNIPFLSQPPRHYTGRAWYKKDFSVAASQTDFMFYFYIECAKWKSEVWIDGKKAGEDMSLCTPHCVKLGCLKEGIHTLTVCIDNRFLLPYRPDGHGISDALGASWNGMTGQVELRLFPMVELKNVRIIPFLDSENAENARCVYRIFVENHTSVLQKIRIECMDDLFCEQFAKPGLTSVDLTEPYPIPSTEWWDEFSPCIHHKTFRLIWDKSSVIQDITCDFGVRFPKVKDGKFYINHRERYFRGTHFGGDFPMTGYPDFSLGWWVDKMRIIKQWGLNFIRFHSFCPPEAAFEAADREGVYLQVECGMWNTFYEGCEMTDISISEAYRILDTFGNHPSFVMLSPSNEPGGSWWDDLPKWVSACRAYDGRHLYTMQSGWPYPGLPEEIHDTDYVYFHRSGLGKGGGMIRNHWGWKGGDYREMLKGIRFPVICHELGQWCSYPDYKIISEFNGSYLQPGNFKIFKKSLEKHGMSGMDASFAWHSGRLQTAMYKEDLEANFRTPHLYGFELLDLHDYLGQGTALVGILDAFWQSKGYVTPEEWREFCGETVLLARIKNYVVTSNETIRIPVEICHFGQKPVPSGKIVWHLKQNDSILAEGSFTADIGIGKNQPIGEICFCPARDFPTVPTVPFAFSLHARIEGYSCENHWNFWCYPEECPVPAEPFTREMLQELSEKAKIVITNNWQEMNDCLLAGKDVLFCPKQTTLDASCPPVPFRPVFWNAQMGPSWGRGMGLICEEGHPVFSHFPTRSYAEWQWEDILKGARGFRLEPLSSGSSPHVLIRAIDEWNRNANMALMLEGKCEKGRLLLSTLPLLSAAGTSVGTRWLLFSVLNYMQSASFAPKNEIRLEDLWKNFYPHKMLPALGGKIYEERNPARYFPELTDWDAGKTVLLKDGHPYHLYIEWNGLRKVDGIYYMPVQNDRLHEGEMHCFRVDAMEDNNWVTKLSGRRISGYRPDRLLFSSPALTDKLRITVDAGFEDENILFFLPCREGWYAERKNLKDNAFSAAILNVLFAEEEWRHFEYDIDDLPEGVNSASSGLSNETSTKTAEIDN